MKNREAGNCIKLKSYQYAASFQVPRSRFQSIERNPIKVVIDKIGANGIVEQQIVNQNQLFEKEAQEQAEFKHEVIPKVRKNGSLPNLLPNPLASQKPSMSRSHVFNRFQYDNYQSLPPEKIGSSLNARKKRVQSKHKNIETVFCENKFPEFVNKSNEKIQQIFKKQQNFIHNENKKFIASQIQKEKPIPVRRAQKTTLANCLKQFATLQKLSIFMETDQNLREKYLRYGLERDPSRTLLIDVLNHRFTFMKQVNRRLRDNIYRCLLKRDDIHVLSKISVQEYIRFYEMFVGRDAGLAQTASFIYLILFGNNDPTFEIGKNVIEQANGPLNKQRAAIEELFSIVDHSTPQQIINSIANSQQFMRVIVDLIIQK